MNYSLKINDVSLASFLIALGFPMYEYEVISALDLNTNTKREKSAVFNFGDYSMFYNKLGNCEDVIKLFKLPEKYHKCTNLGQYAKLCNHNYQVLKSVITENKPLKQIMCDGYIMLKNDSNADDCENIPTGFVVGTKNISAIAIAATLGCKLNGYAIHNGELIASMDISKEALSVKTVEMLLDEYAVGGDFDYDPLHVLIAMMLNRKELMSGIYNTEKVVVLRGEGLAYFDKNASDEIKEKLIDGLNSL